MLIDSKPHLFAITSDYQPGMRSGDAWMSICWNGDGLQLNKDLPEMKYTLASDGGEIWSDFYCIPKECSTCGCGICLYQLPAGSRGSGS